MRASLRLLALSSLAGLVACANGGGRGAHDAHVAAPDTGGTIDGGDDAAAIGPVDTGASMPDAAAPIDAADTNDAGNDGGAPDTGPVDANRPDSGCRTVMDCADGLICDGVEQCVAGSCVSGTAPTCDDSIPCTRDTCAEPGGCTFMPDNTLCGAGEVCSPTAGCVSGTTCSESPCRLLAPQCGCPTGEGCYPQGTTESCAPAGTGTAGSACTNDSSCAIGYACLNVSSSTTVTANLCMHMCATDSECGGGLCIYTLNDGMGGTIPNLHLCTHPCNAATQVGCAAGTTCEVLQESATTMRLFTDCVAPSGAGTQGATCATTDDCAAGYYCDTSTCRHWCEYPAGTGCSGGTTCMAVFGSLVVDGVSYGLCI